MSRILLRGLLFGYPGWGFWHPDPNFGCRQEVTENLGDCASGITAREPGSADPRGPGTECWLTWGGNGKCRGSCFGDSFIGYLASETLHTP
jgi:hypothetical protein